MLDAIRADREWPRYGVDVAGGVSGLTDELEKCYDGGRHPWQVWESGVSGEQGYRVVTNDACEAPVVPARSGHEQMAVFALSPGVRVDGLYGGAFAARLREAVMKVVPDPPPPEVSGHGVNAKPHVAYVPLPDVGHSQARGQLLGFGVLFPRGKTELAVAVTGALARAPYGMFVRHAGMSVTLQPFDAGAQHGSPLNPSWWSRPARSWTTVTPLVLDRFSGRANEEKEIARHCVLLGLPEPTGVLTSHSPLVPGGTALRRHQLARPDDRRPFTHARIEFPMPVAGPLVLGAQRHVGMGLCVPAMDAAR